MSRLFAAAALAGCLLASAPVSAQVTAHFRVHSLDGGCRNGNPEFWPDTQPERHFRMGVFDSYALGGTCASGCNADSNPATADVQATDYYCSSNNVGCGAWNSINETVSKVIPPQQGVYFYFGLFDNDPDASDHLGDHWVFRNTPVSNADVANNNSGPYKPNSPISRVCGDTVEVHSNSGGADNYNLRYSIWFTDASGPVLTNSQPSNQDDGLYDVDDNDTRLEWQWTLASDPDSGISGYTFDLQDVTSGTTNIFTDQPAPSDGHISLCPSGCDRAFTPQDGHRYRLRVRARNGSLPTLNNQAPGTSPWSASIRVDRSKPTSSIVAPEASSWHNGDFSLDFEDIDPAGGSGLNSSLCEWSVASGGTTTAAWAPRTCNGSRTATVGVGANCNQEGADVCVVSARSADNARNDSDVGTRSFGIDWTPDPIGAITVRDQAGGVVLSGWTMDRDPYFSWPAAPSLSPIVGYSWAMNAAPDCGSIEVPANAPLEVAIPIGQLNDGVHQFQVRAIDAAGNCGPVQTATVQIDGTAENVLNLRAFDRNNNAISPATWQQENMPTMQWDAPTSISPIAGYSYGTGPLTDCIIETNATSAPASTLPEGITSFWVRAVDTAGNCGPPATFALHVDSVPDPILNLQALTQQAGTPIFPGTPQADNSPWMQWDIPLSTSPIVGYSFGITPTTDCTIETSLPGAQINNLPEGTSTFWVRAVDAAGNCGPEATFTIIVSICGDGNIGPGEQCDDGNDDDTDACVMCLDAVCGDGAVWDGVEECDDGADNGDEPDVCRADCTLPRCGDGIVDSGESCDEGDLNSDDPDATCRTNCALATCGDGVIDDGEECDDGEDNSDDEAGACRTTCVAAYCGDGIVDPLEACDEGVGNSDTMADTCRTDCSTPQCGDGVLDTNEECDDGPANSDSDPDACRTICVASFCGDGVVDSDEQCEPAISGDDLCNQDCTFGSSAMDPDQDDVSVPTGDDVGVSNNGNNTSPDIGTTPDLGLPDGSLDIAAADASCCTQVHSRTDTGWQILLAALAAGVIVARRRRR